MMVDDVEETRPTYAVLRQRMLSLAARRGADKSICPSEVARSFGKNWTDLMPRIHQVAEQLCAERLLEYQKGGISHGQNRPSGAYRLCLIPDDGD